jgi:hypothetical protein
VNCAHRDARLHRIKPRRMDQFVDEAFGKKNLP